MNVTDQFKKWDVALTGGVAFQFPHGLSIQAGYEYGLSRIDANSRLKLYNNAVKVGLGFNF
jgi:opacity protein-like surface antigen